MSSRLFGSAHVGVWLRSSRPGREVHFVSRRRQRGRCLSMTSPPQPDRGQRRNASRNRMGNGASAPTWARAASTAATAIARVKPAVVRALSASRRTRSKTGETTPTWALPRATRHEEGARHEHQTRCDRSTPASPRPRGRSPSHRLGTKRSLATNTRLVRPLDARIATDAHVGAPVDSRRRGRSPRTPDPMRSPHRHPRGRSSSPRPSWCVALRSCRSTRTPDSMRSTASASANGDNSRQRSSTAGFDGCVDRSAPRSDLVCDRTLRGALARGLAPWSV